MALMSEALLRDAGCDERLASRICETQRDGDLEGCLRLLRLHRCELVMAMHEAQRPIDACDLIIQDLQRA